MMYLGRCALFIFATIFFSIVYIRCRDRDQEQLGNRMWLMVWYIGMPANMGVVAVWAHNQEFCSIRKEIKNGMIGTFSYLLASQLLMIPFMVLFGLCSLGISGYGIIGLWPARFGEVLIMYAVTMYCFESFAQLFSLGGDPLLGMMNFINIWFASFLFGGFLVGNDDVVWPIRTFAYILPLKYCIKSMVYSEYIDADDYTPCDTSDPDEICFGNTGKEVLATLGKLYHLFDDESTFAQDFGFILAICAAIKTMYFVGLVMESRKVSTIKSA